MPLTYDKKAETYTCPIHGDVTHHVGWVHCFAGCDDGMVDDYEEDPLMYDPGDMSECETCNGEGGWTVCGECNKDNPDFEPR